MKSQQSTRLSDGLLVANRLNESLQNGFTESGETAYEIDNKKKNVLELDKMEGHLRTW